MFLYGHKDFKRVLSLFSVFCILFSFCAIKIIKVQNSTFADVSEMQFTKSISLSQTRGYIYDRNMLPLVNDERTRKTAVLVKEDNKREVEEAVGTNNLQSGLCLLLDENYKLEEGSYIKNYYTVTRYKDKGLCTHITGYINSEGVGVCGIEKAFDRILAEANGSLTVSYDANAQGRALAGDGLEITDDNYDSPAGVVLTIDKNIQIITEDAMNNSDIACGAVVVMNTETFEIEGIYSNPAYSQTDVASSLSDPCLPFLNRAFSSYPVGSVFKPVVAAAAFQNGVSFSETVECNGFVEIDTNIFRCFNRNSHGRVDINLAIEKSCNCYFIETGIKAGAKNLIETAELFGFGKETSFCSTLVSVSGNLPAHQSITSDSQLANLCFGQGELLATPVQLAAAYSVLANGGIYKTPSLLKTLINDKGEVYAYYKTEDSHKVINKDIAEIINTCLYNNMLNGTGVNGAPSNTTSAGKTATAQTGRYDENGNEELCTWFAGFFPYEKPIYAVVVLNEKGSIASSDCAPVFKVIAEGITEYLNGQKVS